MNSFFRVRRDRGSFCEETLLRKVPRPTLALRGVDSLARFFKILKFFSFLFFEFFLKK